MRNDKPQTNRLVNGLCHVAERPLRSASLPARQRHNLELCDRQMVCKSLSSRLPDCVWRYCRLIRQWVGAVDGQGAKQHQASECVDRSVFDPAASKGNLFQGTAPRYRLKRGP